MLRAAFKTRLAMSGTDTPVGMQQEKDRKKAALEELLEKTRAEYAGVWDEASAEIRMTHQFDGLSADPDQARSGTKSELARPF